MPSRRTTLPALSPQPAARAAAASPPRQQQGKPATRSRPPPPVLPPPPRLRRVVRPAAPAPVCSWQAPGPAALVAALQAAAPRSPPRAAASPSCAPAPPPPAPAPAPAPPPPRSAAAAPPTAAPPAPLRPLPRWRRALKSSRQDTAARSAAAPPALASEGTGLPSPAGTSRGPAPARACAGLLVVQLVQQRRAALSRVLILPASRTRRQNATAPAAPAVPVRPAARRAGRAPRPRPHAALRCAAS
eukprot:scaffold434_cov358-Prasinococcus_capsulatus_cf.AAC.20